MKLRDMLIDRQSALLNDHTAQVCVDVVIQWLADQKVALDRKKLPGHTIEQLITALHTEQL